MTMSTSCATCVRSLFDLRALRTAFGDEELALVGIPVDSGDSAQALREYAEEKRPAYALQIGLSQETVASVRDVIASTLHAGGSTTPASIITDSSGLILTARWGVPTLSELRKLRATKDE